MKIVRKKADGETRELLLKEYFLNAYLIAALKSVGEQVRRARGQKFDEPAVVPVRRS
ncbi:hypothetical protein HNR46_001391 [Haloferula luteola]|uniref:Uncharacterized protein n=1 Tax=Haloferula luteola TaxID=595692 RepID=A0A840UYD5_9BACT|nr:hypothetical protein [Haloferula luteola]MBB5351157.1 hypothetical protein [Haloferula luteola]